MQCCAVEKVTDENKLVYIRVDEGWQEMNDGIMKVCVVILYYIKAVSTLRDNVDII